METMKELCVRPIRYPTLSVKDGLIHGTITGTDKKRFDKQVKFLTGVEWAYLIVGFIYIHFKDGTEIIWYVSDIS